MVTRSLKVLSHGSAGCSRHFPVLVEYPTVIGTAQTFLLGYAVLQGDAPVGTWLVDESQVAGLVSVEHQVLAQDPYLLDRLRI